MVINMLDLFGENRERYCYVADENVLLTVDDEKNECVVNCHMKNTCENKDNCIFSKKSK